MTLACTYVFIQVNTFRNPSFSPIHAAIGPCTHPFGATHFRYSVYVLTLSTGDLTFDSYASALREMSSSPSEIRRRGFHVLTLPTKENDKPQFYLPLLKTQGIVVAVIVETTSGYGVYDRFVSRRPSNAVVKNDDNFSASYVATVNYGCDIAREGDCYKR